MAKVIPDQAARRWLRVAVNVSCARCGWQGEGSDIGVLLGAYWAHECKEG